MAQNYQKKNAGVQKMTGPTQMTRRAPVPEQADSLIARDYDNQKIVIKEFSNTENSQ